MTAAQSEKVYWYLRADADHDVSTDPLALSLDGGATWITSGIDPVAQADWPASVIDANTEQPTKAGMTGYWWRIFTGPGTAFPLNIGRNSIRGKLTDDPEEPHFSWVIKVAFDA